MSQEESTEAGRSEALAEAPIARLLESLMAYAMDPTQWDAFVDTMAQHEDAITQMDPSEFLAHLSHAESLAWQLRHEPDAANPAQYSYVLLDRELRVTATSDNFADLSAYMWIDEDGGLQFADAETDAEMLDIRQRVLTSDQTQALLTIKGSDKPAGLAT